MQTVWNTNLEKVVSNLAVICDSLLILINKLLKGFGGFVLSLFKVEHKLVFLKLMKSNKKI